MVLLLALCTTVLMSCTNHGKKVTVAGTKGEVYYKGDGVTEADAVKLGSFLKENSYFDDKEKTVQIKKAGANYEVRMVVDMDVVNKTPGMDDAFTFFGTSISKHVFNNTPTLIILCDKQMNDKKTYPFKPEMLIDETKKEEPATSQGDESAQPDLSTLKEISFQNNSLYYDASVSGDEAQVVFDYLKKNEFFEPGGNNDVILKKGDGESAIFQFPVKKAFANEEGLSRVEAFITQMKSDLFSKVTMSFNVMDENFSVIKTYTL